MTAIAKYAGAEVCGHCWSTATLLIMEDGWSDYECLRHAEMYWPEGMEAWAKAATEAEYNGHAGYPHDPGTLNDCRACEDDCHCEALRADGWLWIECVYCLNSAPEIREY